MSKIILKSNFFILTGGPGSGKTSVLMALKKRGFLTVPEVARDIIKEQLTLDGNAMHTGDRQAFLEKMLVHSLDDYLKIQHEKTAAFFDREIGLHLDKNYNNDKYFIEDMLVYDHEQLEKWSCGLDREYPRFCPDFDKNKLTSLINLQLDRINTKA